MPKAKQLKELEEEKNFRVLTRFKKRNMGKCYKIVAGQYFLKDYPITVT